MANFSNATEYMAYVEKWCVKCYHYGTDIGVDDDGCPILDIHQQLMQCRNDVMPWGEEETDCEVENAKDMLIRRTGVHNEQCRMFIPKGRVEQLPIRRIAVEGGFQ